MLSVDAIFQEALYYGAPEPDAATKNERREKLLRFAETATKNSVKVLVMDSARSRRTIDDSHRLNSVKNFLYLRDSTSFGRQDEFALERHGTNYDMVVVDVFHGRTPLSKQAVETLKFKMLGARRLFWPM
jgi:hypothetical protein